MKIADERNIVSLLAKSNPDSWRWTLKDILILKLYLRISCTKILERKSNKNLYKNSAEKRSKNPDRNDKQNYCNFEKFPFLWRRTLTMVEFLYYSIVRLLRKIRIWNSDVRRRHSDSQSETRNVVRLGV